MATLFVSDLDGTLLDREAQLSSRTREGLASLLERNVAFTIATARSIVSVRERVDLPLRLPVICANGTFVDEIGQPGHRHVAGLDRDLARAVWDAAGTAGLELLVTTTSPHHGDRMFFPEAPREPTASFLKDRIEHADPRTRVVAAAVTERALAEDTVTGLVAIDAASRLGPFEALVADAHGARLSVHLNDDYYLRGYQWLTVNAARATKGEGVRWMRERYAADTERLVVFGDQTNDLPMFAIADHAVATANADPSVKEAADEVIGDHHDDAVITWLERNA